MKAVKQHRLKQMILVHCTECDNAYYTSESWLEIVMPKEIRRECYFPTRCPICKRDGYSQLVDILFDGKPDPNSDNLYMRRRATHHF